MSETSEPTPRENSTSPCEELRYRPSATLLSRLAEAVDGCRKGEPVYFVCRYRYDADDEGHRLHGPYPDCETAAYERERMELRADEYGIYGPYYTRGSDGWEIGSRRKGIKEVVVRYEDGSEIVLDTKEYDSLFWSGAAAEKFALPYYVAIGTLDEGIALRTRGLKADLLAHRIGSGTEAEFKGIDADGQPITVEEDFGVGLYALKLVRRGAAGATRTMLKGTLISVGLDSDNR